jgi:hypothetical protein
MTSSSRFVHRLLIVVSLWVSIASTTLAADEKPDVAAIASQLLDDNLSQEERKQIVLMHPEAALDLLKTLTDGLKPGMEEYRRIPWIWRVAIEAAKRDEGTQVRDILFFSLPGHGQPLRDWQAVVIGGGIINGLSQKNIWPREHISDLLIDDEAMFARWTMLFFQAQRMAENEVVPTGTRYDALRILGCGEWEPHGVFLLQYLVDGNDDELQMGAVSGLVDIDSPYSTKALSDAFLHLKGKNRKLAIAGLLRNGPRADALLFSIEADRISSVELEPEQIKQLREHADPAIRERAAKLLK